MPQDSIGSRFLLDGNVQTLSSNHAPKDSISGLLFVPSLPPDDPCNNITAPFVPENVTRHEDVSSFRYDIIGLAPWVSADCTRSFLAASQKAMTTALIFFQPGSGSAEEQPPPADDPSWNLGDQGKWKRLNEYPVYAIPGPAGAMLMDQLALYSGNSTVATTATTTTAQNSNGNDTNNASSDRLEPVRLFTIIDLGEMKTNPCWTI